MDLVVLFFLSVAMGNLLAVMASGVTLTYSVMRFSNFAHGEFIVIGAYVSYFGYFIFGRAPLYITVLPAFVAGALAAVVLHYIMFRPLTKRKATLVALLVGSIAVSFIFKYTLYILISIQGLWAFIPQGRVNIPAIGGPHPTTVMQFLSFSITDFFILSLIAALGTAVFLSYFLFFTTPGKFCRAVAENQDLAQSLGIPIEKIRLISWVLIGGFASLGGALLEPSFIFGGLTPELGLTVLFYVFAAAILGGRTDFYATLVSAYVVAFASIYGITIASVYFGVPSAMQPAIPFAIMVATLLLRPAGISGIKINSLLGKRSARVAR